MAGSVRQSSRYGRVCATEQQVWQGLCYRAVCSFIATLNSVRLQIKFEIKKNSFTDSNKIYKRHAKWCLFEIFRTCLKPMRLRQYVALNFVQSVPLPVVRWSDKKWTREHFKLWYSGLSGRWVMTCQRNTLSPCSNVILLRNLHAVFQDCTVSQPSRLECQNSPLWKPVNLFGKELFINMEINQAVWSEDRKR